MLSINTNVMALNAQLALRQHTDQINRLAKILIDANGGGSSSAALDKVSASVVPTYLTSTIRGSAQALANTDKATDLMNKEKTTLDNIIEALNAMKSAAEIIFDPNTWMYSPTEIEAAESNFEYAQKNIPIYIASNTYNGIELSNRVHPSTDAPDPLNFQVGGNANEKISFELPRLSSGTIADQISAVENLSIPDQNAPDYTTINKINTALDGINQANGSVTAMISQLGFAKSRLQVDLDNSIDYRSSLLSDAVISANAKLAVQEMLKSVAQSMLAQANVSNQGILDLISSTRIQ